MVRSLTIMLVAGLVLGMGAPAFSQTYYYGNPYSGQQQAYGGYGSTYGQPEYQQYAQPGYGQYNQYAQPQQGTGAYQTAPGSYYQNYGQYLQQGRYGYDPGAQAYAPRGAQQYPNNYYRQQAQPNPYYGMPQTQQWESPQTTYSTTPVRRARSRSTRRTARSPD